MIQRTKVWKTEQGYWQKDGKYPSKSGGCCIESLNPTIRWACSKEGGIGKQIKKNDKCTDKDNERWYEKLKAGFIQLLMNEDLPEVRQFLKNTIKKLQFTIIK